MPVLPPLVLASTSTYRFALLQRFRIPFIVEAPDVDEGAADTEPPHQLARRLAQLKARTVAQRHPGALVLGSDQVAQVGAQRLGKPGTRANAIAQLQVCSGQTVEFATAVCLIDGRSGTVRDHLDSTLVTFRTLSLDEIQRYVDADEPFDCAGAFRSESLGAALVESMRTEDPTALIGLPLVATARLLRDAGFNIP